MPEDRGDLIELIEDVGRVRHAETEHAARRDGVDECEEEVGEGHVVGPAQVHLGGRRGQLMGVGVAGQVAAVGPEVLRGQPQLLDTIFNKIEAYQ